MFSEFKAIGATTSPQLHAQTNMPNGQLVDQFHRLMLEKSLEESGVAPVSTTSKTLISALVQQQTELHQKVQQEASSLVENSGKLDMETMHIRQLNLAHQAAAASMQFTAMNGVSKGLKSGLTTLMKNQ